MRTHASALTCTRYDSGEACGEEFIANIAVFPAAGGREKREASRGAVGLHSCLRAHSLSSPPNCGRWLPGAGTSAGRHSKAQREKPKFIRILQSPLHKMKGEQESEKRTNSF